MNIMKKVVPLISLGMFVAMSASVGAADKPIYWNGSDGNFVKDSYGSCVRTIDWKSDLALAECEPGMAKVAKAVEFKAVEPAPAVVAKAAPAVVTTTEKISLEIDAFFDVNKANIKTAGQGKLDALVEKIKADNTSIQTITVTGHASAPGSTAYNQRLSEQRAANVKSYLVSKGVDGSIIVSQGMGESNPIASNNNAAGRAKNQRVDIDIKAERTVTSDGSAKSGS